MSTRGNVLFVDHFWLEESKITEEDIINNSRYLEGAIENSYKIYVHSDMYPSGAIDDLQEFLRLDGAKHRATDSSYLSAWFVGWKCLDMSRWTRSFSDRDFDAQKNRNPSLKNFKESRDFFGIGLLQEISDWASYSYLIIPNIVEEKGRYQFDENSFNILIYDGDFRKFLGLINSEDGLEDIQHEEWWY